MRHRAPNTANVLSNLVRIRTLELGELRCTFDLEEYLLSLGGDDLDSWHPRSAVHPYPITLLIQRIRVLLH